MLGQSPGSGEPQLGAPPPPPAPVPQGASWEPLAGGLTWPCSGPGSRAARGHLSQVEDRGKVATWTPDPTVQDESPLLISGDSSPTQMPPARATVGRGQGTLHPPGDPTLTPSASLDVTPRPQDTSGTKCTPGGQGQSSLQPRPGRGPAREHTGTWGPARGAEGLSRHSARPSRKSSANRPAASSTNPCSLGGPPPGQLRSGGAGAPGTGTAGAGMTAAGHRAWPGATSLNTQSG